MDPDDFVRAYANAYTFGIEPHAHLDDGDFTIIYYPSMWWKLKWERNCEHIMQIVNVQYIKEKATA